MRPLPEETLLLGTQPTEWLGLVQVWLDGGPVDALCSCNEHGECNFIPLVAGGVLRNFEVTWWRPWWGGAGD